MESNDYILVLNSGSSSLKFKLYSREGKQLLDGLFDSIGSEDSFLEYEFESEDEVTIKKFFKNHEEALEFLISVLEKHDVDRNKIAAIGHRVVHGGTKYDSSIIVNKKELSEIEDLNHLAPLHNPNNLKGIKVSLDLFENAKNVAVFDTSFFNSMPEVSKRYAIPVMDEVKKYGFHGLSYSYISEVLKKDYGFNDYIICHLGNGASISVVKNGRPIDTTMGLTPLQGIIMGTRSGDVDPGVLIYLSREKNMSIDEIDTLLNKKSGLKALCGTNDMRKIWAEVETNYQSSIFEKPNNDFELAFRKYIQAIVKYVGAFKAEAINLDAIVFTGGIGEKAFYVREKILEHFPDIEINYDKNKNNETILSSDDSKIKALKLKTNEEFWIFEETKRLIE